ncbi:MAG: NADH:ubiquinone reductase (Na(+)-transporting) subunit F [bacterium]|nr:NADH:ubiquinone reductase (Na(+)-transporting) subunit F [bacterium]
MMITVISTLVIFTVVILILTAVIIFAELKLVPKGEVKLVINNNEEDALTVESGSTLLNTLTSNEIFLPSACGGMGTCGACECRILEGGGDILPTEKTHISRRMEKQHYRLACQAKVKEDLKIVVPEEVFSIQKWECEVVSNDNVATFIKEFIVKLPEGEQLNFKSGGYVQIEVPSYKMDFGKDIDIESQYRDDWEKFGFFDLKMKNSEYAVRAYSMANHPAEGDIVMLNIRIATPPFDRATGKLMDVPAGVGSSFLFKLKAGDKVTVSGPYGEFFIQDTNREMIYIGGGAGMAPMRSHIFHLAHTLKTKRKVSYWYGARSMREMFYEDHFLKIEKMLPNFSFHLALSDPLPEDNWKGYTGFIHQCVLDEYLKDHPEPEEIEYYLCGPPVMLDAVKDMLYNLGVEPEMIMYDEFS